MMSSDLGCSEEDIAAIRHRFSRYDIRNGPTIDLLGSLYPKLRRGSVLVPFFLKNQQWRVLLTVRSRRLRSYTGMVALPGGLRDNSDVDEVDTALREAEEEISISRRDVTVLAVLFPKMVGPNYIVFPVIAIIPDWFQAKRSPDEVASVFDLPLDTFFKDFSVQYCRIFGIDYRLFHFPRVVDNVDIDVWGFTAIVCMQVASIVYNTGNIVNSLKSWKPNDGHDENSPARFVFHHLCQHIKPKL